MVSWIPTRVGEREDQASSGICANSRNVRVGTAGTETPGVWVRAVTEMFSLAET